MKFFETKNEKNELVLFSFEVSGMLLFNTKVHKEQQNQTKRKRRK